MTTTLVEPRPTDFKSLVERGSLLPLDRYKKKIVAFSGGKDSIATTLMLLEMGVPPEEIELWHHLIDGAPGQIGKFDWPITEDYVRAFGEHLGIPVRFSWKDGGFEGELFRDNALTKGVYFEDGDGSVQHLPSDPPLGYCKGCRAYFEGEETHCKGCGKQRQGYSTRMKYPMLGANLMTRWCSAYLKIDVCRRVICNDPRFKYGCTLVLSGERHLESDARALLDAAEVYNETKTRLVHQWRGVIGWTEEDVWAIMKRWGIVAHPCYRLGFSRCSCMTCIFGNKDQWATVRKIAPDKFSWHAKNETTFGVTIKKGLTIVDQADRGCSFKASDNPELIALALGQHYPRDQIVVRKGQEWVLPAGAFKSQGGPT
jgi:3'-phosphoadenosine 5'-phosphosulfate sulfotransferase (PAPS reductase)/FAD synthetase